MTTRSVPRSLLFLTVLSSVLLFAVFMPTCEAKLAVPGTPPRQPHHPQRIISTLSFWPGRRISKIPIWFSGSPRIRTTIRPDIFRERSFCGGRILAIPIFWVSSGWKKSLVKRGLRETERSSFTMTPNLRRRCGRIFWMLEYLGCKNVRIFNGGWGKWLADGHPVDKEINSLPPAAFSAKAEPDYLRKRILSRRDSTATVLLSLTSDG